VEPLEKVFEHSVAVFSCDWSSSKSAAKRRGNSSLVGQVLDADDAPVHVIPGRGLLLRVADHSGT
jgi:hypothetical protein